MIATAEAPVMGLSELAAQTGQTLDLVRSRLKIDAELKRRAHRVSGVLVVNRADVEVFRTRLKLKVRELQAV